MSAEGPQARAFNQSLMPGRIFAQSNHRGVIALSRGLLHLMRESFPEMHGFKQEEHVVALVRELYMKAETTVLQKIIKSYDSTPVFDFEIY